MKINFGKLKLVREVRLNELEHLLREHFPGIQPELVAREEWNNNEYHLFTVDGKLDRSDTNELDDYIAGEWTRWNTTQVLLNALCLKQVIPVGTYLIEVS